MLRSACPGLLIFTHKKAEKSHNLEKVKNGIVYKMKVIYITAQIPYGKGETFILEELKALKKQNLEVIVIPRNPSSQTFHQDGKMLANSALWLPLINMKMIISFMISLIINHRVWTLMYRIFKNSNKFKTILKNLIVLPKSIYLARILKDKKIKHVHAHWGSTTATMAYVISKLTGISWSFTLHRWDIAEKNMLREKVKTAKFVRCISEHGKDELITIIGKKYEGKIKVVHIGVEVPEEILELQKNKDFFTMAIPANLLEVKGHKYLSEACEILVNRGIKNFECIFYGVGPLRRKLDSIIRDKNLTEYVKLPGAIPHEKLLGMYKNSEVDIVILPSINTSNGDHEGIPAALMEAMAYGIPVISTNTGGIPELIGDGNGIMVEEKNSLALADAIEKLMKKKAFREEIGKRGRLKVIKDFNLEFITKDLIKLFELD